MSRNPKDNEPPCSLNNDVANGDARYNPPNAMAAHCFQLHDTLKTCYGLSLVNQPELFLKHLELLQVHLDRAKASALVLKDRARHAAGA